MEIDIVPDLDAKTLTILDTGIGMAKADMVNKLNETKSIWNRSPDDNSNEECGEFMNNCKELPERSFATNSYDKNLKKENEPPDSCSSKNVLVMEAVKLFDLALFLIKMELEFKCWPGITFLCNDDSFGRPREPPDVKDNAKWGGLSLLE